MKLNRKNKKAFTIVELVIVIGVIGILSAILIPTFANLTNKANQAKTKEELAGAYTAYVLDATDGYVGEYADMTASQKESAVALTHKGQDAVAFLKDGKYYTYTANSGWNPDGSASAPAGYGAVAGATYNGFALYY